MSDIRKEIGDLLEEMCLKDLEAMVTILQKKFREYKLKEKTTIGSLLKEEPKIVISIPLSSLTPRQEREVEVGWSRPHLDETTKEVRWSPTLGL